MKMLNALRRWFGLPEKPLATTGDTSVMFVLQSRAPDFVTLRELQQATEIEYQSLVQIAERLAWLGKVHVDREPKGMGYIHRRYAIVKKSDQIKEQGL